MDAEEPMARSRARFCPILAAAFLFLSMGCFELSPPVEERLEIAFRPDGSVEVAVEITIANPAERFTRNAAAKERIREARALYESGRDPWARRFEAVSWDRETIVWEKAGGGLVRLRRTGTIEDPQGMTRFFFDVPLAASYTRGEGFAEFALAPQPPARASRQEREELERLKDAWAREARGYLDQLSGLYAYLAQHPERDRACFGEIYEPCLSEGAKAGLPPLLQVEEERMERLGEAMSALVRYVEVPDDSGRSPDELARWVLDPFPAALTVVVPGETLEVEGFEDMAAGRVGHPCLDFWFALRRLEGSFLSPDPLVPLLQCLREESQTEPLPLEGVLAKPRRIGPAPTEDELAVALDAALSPAPLYRVRWRQ
jgi:hypothetical protein